MPQHEVLAFGSGTGNIPYVLSFGNRGPCRTTSNRQHQNGIADSWREAWHGTKGSQIKLTVKQVTSASPGLSAVPRPSGPANPTIPSMPPIVTKSLEQKHRGLPTDAFSSMDSSYDLEKLSTLYQEEVKSPKALDCKADPSGTTSKANTERAAYDKQARTFERALTKNEANQN